MVKNGKKGQKTVFLLLLLLLLLLCHILYTIEVTSSAVHTPPITQSKLVKNYNKMGKNGAKYLEIVNIIPRFISKCFPR